MYGETVPSSYRSIGWWGLSPHVRGNQLGAKLRQPRRGSIPACTGKPLRRVIGRGPAGVYPRMYGETAAVRAGPVGVLGLSPHVRGNPGAHTPVLRDDGSIPACTGKPAAGAGAELLDAVYPRMYGETGGLTDAERAELGLSPHVRGNLSRRIPAQIYGRSIPACTGKPT